MYICDNIYLVIFHLALSKCLTIIIIIISIKSKLSSIFNVIYWNVSKRSVVFYFRWVRLELSPLLPQSNKTTNYKSDNNII